MRKPTPETALTEGNPTDGAGPADSAGYQSGFGNEFASEALPGALPRGQNSPQRLPLRAVCRTIVRAPHLPRRGQRIGASWLYRIRPSADARPLPAAARRRIAAGRPPRGAARARPSCAGTRLPLPGGADRFRGGPGADGGQRFARCAVGLRHSSLRGQSVDARPLFLQRRRRTADRAATGSAAGSTPSSDASTSSRRKSPSFRAACASASDAAGRRGARLCLRELRRAVQAARSRARSAPTALPTRAIFSTPRARYRGRREPRAS